MTGRVFALTIFLGALLLFSVQPMIGKYILPWFGGGTAVWTACMLFFQLVLLAGYAYAHANIRLLRPKAGAIVHLVLLLLAVATLPIIPKTYWRPDGASNPDMRILLLLTMTLGLPYFVLSATSPLLQAWFGRIHPGKSPYRLYSLSNMGSLSALMLYPFLLEPYLGRSVQAWAWSGAMILYGVLCAVCVIVAWRAQPAAAPEPAPAPPPPRTPAKGEKPSRKGSTKSGAEATIPVTLAVRLRWLALPACAVVLLLAVTNALTLELGAMPFLWVLPLGLYLLSFVICFDHERWYERRIFVPLVVVMAIILVYLMTLHDVELWISAAVYLACLFSACMACHGEVCRLKPEPKHLTGFYLMIAAGGALGGVLVAVVAPLVFTGYFELQIGLLACVLLVAGSRRIAIVAAVATVVIGPLLWKSVRSSSDGDLIAARRNFYGTLEVHSRTTDRPGETLRTLCHGQTVHGTQYRPGEREAWPTTYYSSDSGVGLALRAMTRSNRRIGVVGLGAGTLAVYARPGDCLRFYEINPQVIELAQADFTYLANCQGKLEIVLGDARLSMEREPDQQYDLLVLDAFSGDSIPAHLLTREAFEVYRRHLRPGGVLAAHVTNTYYELSPVVDRLAKDAGFQTMSVSNQAHEWSPFPSYWVLMCADANFFRDPVIAKAARPIASLNAAPLWTDEHTSLLEAIRKDAWGL